MRWRVGAALVVSWLALCGAGHLQSSAARLPDAGSLGDEGAVAVLSAPLPRIGWVARHAWILIRGAREQRWERWEVWQTSAGEYQHVRRDLWEPEEDLGVGGTRVEAVIRGVDAVAAVGCVRREAPQYAYRGRYVVWPGPNSNTFVDVILRKCRVHAPLPSTAVGKDWRGWVGVSTSREGTGLQTESPAFGAVLGAREGIEAHVLSLTVGLRFSPPQTLLPLGDGRFGFP